MLILLASAALVLTLTMFLTKNMLLGFPCFIFWALLAGDAYTLKSNTWDMYYFLFFASIGMAIFCMFAAFALRKRDLEPTSKDWDDSGKYIDEGKGEKADNYMAEGKGDGKYIDEGGEGGRPSRRTQELHARAEARRSGNIESKKRRWGEFG